MVDRLLGLTIFQVGIVESLGGIFLYFVILAHFGFRPERVIGLRDEWTNPSINNLQDSYGQEWVGKKKSYLIFIEVNHYNSFKNLTIIKLIAISPFSLADIRTEEIGRNNLLHRVPGRCRTGSVDEPDVLQDQKGVLVGTGDGVSLAYPFKFNLYKSKHPRCFSVSSRWMCLASDGPRCI